MSKLRLASHIVVGFACLLFPLGWGTAGAAPFTGGSKASDRSGFTAIALVITDPDWLKRWNTRTPGVLFHGDDVLHSGQTGRVGVFFSNAMAVNGRARLNCDVVVRNRASHVLRRSSGECFNGPVGPPNTLMLTGLDLTFRLDKGDEPDVLTISVGVTDDNRHARVPVKVSVRMDPGGPAR